MDIDSIRRMIRESEESDWISHKDGEGATFKHDVNIMYKLSHEDTRFNEEWATQHPDSNAQRATITLSYGASYLGEVVCASVDGGRAVVPLPNLQTKGIPYDDYLAAKFGSPNNNQLDEYIRRSGLTVDPC